MRQHIRNLLRVGKCICGNGCYSVPGTLAFFDFPSVLASDELEVPDMGITDRLTIAEGIEKIEALRCPLWVAC